ncbi:hypothetical protein ASE46_05280 [Bacillus sp. Root239]|nr:hypothetical protein ASE46_05280 [Bacillus sp. Root239]
MCTLNLLIIFTLSAQTVLISAFKRMFRSYTKVSFVDSSVKLSSALIQAGLTHFLIEMVTQTNLVILFIIFVAFTIISKAGN